jgi:stress-induced morphogen
LFIFWFWPAANRRRDYLEFIMPFGMSALPSGNNCVQILFLGLPDSPPWAYRRVRRNLQMAMDAGEIERLIKVRIPDAEVTIRDLAGDGDHYAATVISASFKGKSRVQQHQLVYEALSAQMGGALHALALQTGTP